jgi:nucleotidyltransferase substrate binding protein (TIGR01987 family)
MESSDVRWQQRFSNYNKALQKLSEAVVYIQSNFYREGVLQEELFEVGEDLAKEGIIQRFEYTHELAWNVLKDYFTAQGITGIIGSKDATREAFANGLIADGHIWMDMIRSRNQTSYTYNETTATAIFQDVLERYFPAFLALQQVMEAKRIADENSSF